MKFRIGVAILFLASVGLLSTRYWVGAHPARVLAAQPRPASTVVPIHQMPDLSSRAITPGIIDGHTNPELVPDAVAYRLFFIVASQNASKTAILSAAGASGPWAAQAAKILADFKTQYAELIANYNTSWYVTHNSTAGLSRFLADRDALVQSTRDQLKTALPPKMMAAFDKHVQQEKAFMRVAKGDQ